MNICANCKYCALIREMGDSQLGTSDYYEYCCTNDSFQRQPYISPVSGETVTPPRKWIWCDETNKDGNCLQFSQRDESDGPLKVLNETKLSWGCIFGMLAWILIIAGLYFTPK